MRYEYKTKGQPISELVENRQITAELEVSDTEGEQSRSRSNGDEQSSIKSSQIPIAKSNTPIPNFKAKDMDKDLINTHRKIIRIFRNLIICITIAIFTFVLASEFVFDAFETLVEWFRKHEIIEVHQLITLLVVLAFAFTIFSFLRWKELRHEITKRRQVEEDLDNRNRELEVLNRELSKKNRYETIINTVTRSVHRSVNLQDVLENAVESINQNMERAENVGIYLIEEGEVAVMKAYRGFTDRYMEEAGRIAYPKGFSWNVIIEGKQRYCPDTDQDTLICPAGREMGTKSYLSTPVIFEVKTLGSININSFHKNAFDEEELNLMQIVAQQIGIAINNAQQAEALRESEKKYRALYEDNPSIYFTVDTKGTVLSVNEFGAEQIGYTAEELVGQSVLMVIHPDDIKAVIEQVSMCSQNPGQIASWEFRKVRKNGSMLWVRESARAVKDTDNNTVILIVCDDITERKQSEEKIQL